MILCSLLSIRQSSPLHSLLSSSHFWMRRTACSLTDLMFLWIDSAPSLLKNRNNVESVKSVSSVAMELRILSIFLPRGSYHSEGALRAWMRSSFDSVVMLSSSVRRRTNGCDYYVSSLRQSYGKHQERLAVS